MTRATYAIAAILAAATCLFIGVWLARDPEPVAAWDEPGGGW
jgi:hypothetical protein